MQYLVAISELKSRAEAIGLSVKRLARAAGVHHTTVYRGLAGKNDLRTKTTLKLIRQLEVEERRVAEHLVKIGGERAA